MSDGQTKSRLPTPTGAAASLPIYLLSLLAFIALLATVSFTYGEESSGVPDFADKEKWIFVEEGPLTYPAPWANYEIGKIKKYRHNGDGFLVGFEEFLFGSERPFWKRWGLEHSRFTYHALRRKGSEGWAVGSPGSYWQSFAIFEGAELRGMWFLLFVPPEEQAFGRYFAVSTYFLKDNAQPEKGEASPIRFSQ